MDTKDQRKSVIVGLFLFIGIAIFSISILLLGKQQKLFVQLIPIKAVFNNVSGLKIGNNVWFSGVKIGLVKKLSITGYAEVTVEMQIDEAVKKYIRKNAKVKISSEGFIGNKTIVVYGGSDAAPEIQAGDYLSVGSTISTEEIMNTVQENNKNFLDITRNLKALSAKALNGQGAFGALFSDSSVANNIKLLMGNLAATSCNANKISANFSVLTHKINQPGSLIAKLATDTILFNNLQHSVNLLQQASSSAARITNNLQAASHQLNIKDNALGLLMNDTAIAFKVKKTIENLELSTQKLNENMEALKHNFLFRRYFKTQKSQ